MNMKKKILTDIAICFALILSVIAAGGIYYFVLTEEITLDGMPAPDIEEQIEIYKEMDFCKGGHLTEDNEDIVIYLTRYQRNKWLEFVKEDMKNMLESANALENMEYHVSEDREELILLARRNVSFNSVGIYGMILTYDIELYQILSGEKDWGFKFILKDMDTDEILYTADVPEEKVRVYDYLWDK